MAFDLEGLRRVFSGAALTPGSKGMAEFVKKLEEEKKAAGGSFDDIFETEAERERRQKVQALEKIEAEAKARAILIKQAARLTMAKNAAEARREAQMQELENKMKGAGKPQQVDPAEFASASEPIIRHLTQENEALRKQVANQEETIRRQDRQIRDAELKTNSDGW